MNGTGLIGIANRNGDKYPKKDSRRIAFVNQHPRLACTEFLLQSSSLSTFHHNTTALFFFQRIFYVLWERICML